MKRRHAFLLAVVVGTWGSMGCNKAAPTEPSRALAEPRSEAEQPSSPALAGSWKGTITFHPFAGDYQGFACSGPAPVSVLLSQDGTLLTGRFRTACSGALEIRAVEVGNFLSGSLDVVGGISLGRISGSVSSSRISFKTRTTIGLDETHKGQPPIVSSEVELHRQASVARVNPVLAGEPRPSLGIEVHR
jgi:hypothetical protein